MTTPEKTTGAKWNFARSKKAFPSTTWERGLGEYLLVDAGNTRLKWAVAGPHGKISLAGDMATKDATAGQIAALARKYPRHRAVLACVVPKLFPAFRRAFKGRLCVVSSRTHNLGVRFKYPNPDELGADRLAAVAGLPSHRGGWHPAIIVQCGTATAFTVLDDRGFLCGGAIGPGLETQLAALLGATAQLPAITLRPPRRALGRSTQEAIRAGVMLGFQGGVKEILRDLTKSLPGRRRPCIILTGGHARHLARSLDLPAQVRPLLVFEGLRSIGVRTFWPLPLS
jgi:type III pantothenate kinase